MNVKIDLSICHPLAGAYLAFLKSGTAWASGRAAEKFYGTGLMPATRISRVTEALHEWGCTVHEWGYDFLGPETAYEEHCAIYCE